jgi:hypothetical protein
MYNFLMSIESEYYFIGAHFFGDIGHYLSHEKRHILDIISPFLFAISGKLATKSTTI